MKYVTAIQWDRFPEKDGYYETCWECTGGKLMAGNYPCKVCGATGILRRKNGYLVRIGDRIYYFMEDCYNLAFSFALYWASPLEEI